MVVLLQQIGFTAHEAMVYTALLELRHARASEIAKRAKIARDLTYFYLKRLMVQGLVEKSKKYRVDIYTPKDPGVIIENLEKEHKKVQQKQEFAKKLFDKHLIPLYNV